MISVDFLNAKQMKRYILHLETLYSSQNHAIITLEPAEINNYFNIWPEDEFLLLKYKGQIDEIEKSLKYINFPKTSFRQVMAIKGNADIGIMDICSIQEPFYDYFGHEKFEPIFGVLIDGNSEDVEVTLITKFYHNMDLANKSVFYSLWHTIILDLNLKEDMSFYESLSQINYTVSGNNITIEKLNSTRSDFLMSLKIFDFEKKIREYTGVEWHLRIEDKKEHLSTEMNDYFMDGMK